MRVSIVTAVKNGAAVIGEIMADRADDRELIGNLRLQWEEFADLHPRHIGTDGTEIAAKLGGSVRLEIVGRYLW